MLVYLRCFNTAVWCLKVIYSVKILLQLSLEVSCFLYTFGSYWLTQIKLETCCPFLITVLLFMATVVKLSPHRKTFGILGMAINMRFLYRLDALPDIQLTLTITLKAQGKP